MPTTVRTNAGDMGVRVLARTPHFVTHRAIGSVAPRVRYAVTHQRTGLRLGDFESAGLAKAAAERLEALGDAWDFARLSDLSQVRRGELIDAWKRVQLAVNLPR